MRAALRIEAHAIACAVRVAVRVLPLSRVVAMLSKIPRTGEASRSSTDECARAAVDAARRAAHPTCLYDALTAFALLVRHGHAARLVIGAAHAAGFAAHAWVTVDGMPVQPSAREYVPLWSYGASPARAS